MTIYTLTCHELHSGALARDEIKFQYSGVTVSFWERDVRFTAINWIKWTFFIMNFLTANIESTRGVFMLWRESERKDSVFYTVDVIVYQRERLNVPFLV